MTLKLRILVYNFIYICTNLFPFTVNSEFLARILFSRIKFKEISYDICDVKMRDYGMIDLYQ